MDSTLDDTQFPNRFGVTDSEREQIKDENNPYIKRTIRQEAECLQGTPRQQRKTATD